MALTRLKNIINEVTSNASVKAETDRLTATGVTPATILTAIISAVMQWVISGGTGSIVQLVLQVLKSIIPPTPPSTQAPGLGAVQG